MHSPGDELVICIHFDTEITPVRIRFHYGRQSKKQNRRGSRVAGGQSKMRPLIFSQILNKFVEIKGRAVDSPHDSQECSK